MKHFKPKEAARFLAETPSAVFIDCRSEMEFLFVGHPTGAIHVAWNDGPNWDINPDFVAHVRKATSVNRPVVLICRSGNRTEMAGRFLSEKAGYAKVYNAKDGIREWIKQGRPVATAAPAIARCKAAGAC